MSEPVRIPISGEGLQLLAGLTGLPLPWRSPPTCSRRTTERLSPAVPAAATDPGAELATLGLLDDAGRVPTGVVAALAAFARPDVVLDVDLARQVGRGSAQLRAWHRRRRDRVAWLTLTGGRLELGWCGLGRWHSVLTGLVPESPDPDARDAPARHLSLPLPLLLASGEALRRGRDDLLVELAGRAAGAVRAPEPLDPTDRVRQLRLLHLDPDARLRATVSTSRPRTGQRLGVVSWLRFTDGWRALAPEPGADGRVRLEPVAPARLGAEVARLMVGAGG